MTTYQSFMIPFLICSAIGFFNGLRVVVGEMTNPVFDASERWVTIICWGIVIVWPFGVAMTVYSFT